MARDEQLKGTISLNIRLLNAFRTAADSGISAQVCVTFLSVAERPGISVVELADVVGASVSTVSRQLLDLSGSLRSGAEGYGLLERSQDPTDLRKVTYVVSHRGKLLLDTLKRIVEETNGNIS